MANSDGIAWAETSNVNATSFGGFAEASRSSGGHDSCTPTTYEGHSSGLCPVAGTFVELSGGNLYSNIGFAAAPGTPVRAHIWDVT